MYFPLFLIISLYGSAVSYDEHFNNYALNISQASYCIDTVEQWNCATCQKSIQLVDIVENGGVRALNGIDNENNKIIVSFRGSSNIQNWIDNIQIGHIYPYSNYDDVGVDKGFYKAYSYVRESINHFIKEQNKLYPSYNILITGHSLGAALGTLAAFESVYLYEIKPDKIQLLTYGSPRVGNKAFKQYMMAIVFSWRTTHYYDIVPHVPEEFLDYIHITQEIWYNKDNSVYKTCNDIEKEDSSCSNSCAPTKCISIDDHLDYLNITMGNNGLC
jgi:predicted lipase